MGVGDETATLYFRQTPTHLPSWVKLFKPVVGIALDGLYNSGTAAVLFVTSAGRLFALTFGYGRALLKTDCHEENFGLRVVLNAVDPDKLRSVDAQSLSAVPVNRRSQASVATNLSDFGLDVDQDLIFAATGKPKETTLGKQLTGKDAVKLSVPVELTEIGDLLQQLFAKYGEDTYKENFAWIDHLAQVRDPTLLSQLDAELGGKIASGDFSRTWLAIPDVVDWLDFGGFKYQQPKRDIARDDIDWPSYLEFLGDTAPQTAETFRKHSVLRMSESSSQPTESWAVYRCIYCELNFDGHLFALSNGGWYRIDPDFLDLLGKAIAEIPPSTLALPDYTDNSEAEYNKRVAASDPGQFALMDRVLVRHGGGSSKIEFCDLYTTNRQLVHVKRYGGSSVLSHLFAQGVASAQLLLADADFRQKVNNKLPASHRFDNPSQRPVAANFEVIYAVASNGPKDALDLPLFSKITLRNCHSRLELMGLRVSLCVVPVTAG